MVGVGATYSYNNGVQGGTASNFSTASTTYTPMGVSTSAIAGTSGKVILTISADVTVASRCTLSFSGPGQTAAADTFSMRAPAAGPITQVFVLSPSGINPGDTLNYALHYKTSSSSCTVNEVSLVVMAP